MIMGKNLKYVSEFEFPSDRGYSGSAGKTMVKGYARGGAADMAQDKAMIKAAVQKHERSKHPGEPLTKLAKGGKASRMRNVIRNEREEMARVEAKRRDAGDEISRVRSEMRRDMAEMKGMPARRAYPVDRREPMIPQAPLTAMAKGGMTPKQQAKVGRVMGEFKAGELHSGKDGPVVRNRKQAVAIAMSEGRKAGKK